MRYKINGLWSWIATLAVFLVCVSTRTVDASFIATHGGELLVAANIYGVLVTTISTVKCYLSTPTSRDVRFSGSPIPHPVRREQNVDFYKFIYS